MIKLGLIEKDVYSAFINRQFKRGKKSFATSALAHLIYDQMEGKTAYIQEVCNHLFESDNLKMMDEEIFRVIGSLIEKNESHFITIKRGLTAIQFKVLWGIAKLEKLYLVTGSEMSKTSGVHNAVSIKKAIEKLLKIEVIYSDSDEKGDYFTIDDIFLKLWLLKTKAM